MAAPDASRVETTEGDDTPLAEQLRARIHASGPMPLAAFVLACLHDPVHGYYRNHQPLGMAGDFITAPEISQLFGEIIGAWTVVVAEALRNAEPNDAVRLIELGPGRGTLMSDVLRVAQSRPELAGKLGVHLVEQNERLREQQRSTLESNGHQFSFHDALEDVPCGPSILLANEFFDCLPIDQLVWQGDSWRLRCVGLDDSHQFQLQCGEQASIELTQLPEQAPEQSATLETCPELPELVSKLATRLRASPGVALIIDYGTSETTYGDTLQAIRNHQHVDPLSRPGETDITAHVNFAELARLARRNDLNVYGPMPQAQFLTELGLVQRLAKLMNGADAATRNQLELAAGRLAAPGAMGNVFKVMALTSPQIGPPPPFTLESQP
ncbi:MAG: SAM-dependent methyltransferase [Pseudomonadota bacterium]